jgi:hypothetical protein
MFKTKEKMQRNILPFVALENLHYFNATNSKMWIFLY